MPNNQSLRVGDRVHDKDDPRRIGRVTRVQRTSCVDVTWEETGIRSPDVPVQSLKRLPRLVKPALWRAIQPKED